MTALFFVSNKVFSTIATYYIYSLSASDNCMTAGATPTLIAVFLLTNWLGTICSFSYNFLWLYCATYCAAHLRNYTLLLDNEQSRGRFTARSLPLTDRGQKVHSRRQIDNTLEKTLFYYE